MIGKGWGSGALSYTVDKSKNALIYYICIRQSDILTNVYKTPIF